MRKFLLSTAVTATVLGLLLAAAPALLKITGFDEPLKRFLLPRLIADTGTRLDVKDFQVGLGSVQLNNVSLASNRKDFRIKLNRIRFDIYPHLLLLHWGSPQKAIKSISIVQPEIILTSNDTTRMDRSRQDSSGSADFEADQLIQIFNSIKSINKINIRDGRIIWRSGDHRRLIVSQRLNGTLLSRNLSNIIIQADGGVLSRSDNNFRLTATVNLLNNDVSLNLNLYDYSLEESVLPELIDNLQLTSGRVTADISILSKKFNPDSSSMQGKIVVYDAAGSFLKHTFTNTSFTTLVLNNKATIENGRGFYGKDSLHFNGAVDDLLNPVIKLAVRCPAFELENIPELSGIEHIGPVRFALDADIELNPIRKSVRLSGHLPWLNIAENTTVSNVRFRASLDSATFKIPRLSLLYNNVVFTGQTFYHRESRLLNINVAGRYFTGIHDFLDGLSEKQEQFGLRLIYHLPTNNISGNWQAGIQVDQDTTFYARGNILGTSDDLVVSLAQSNNPNFKLNLELTDLFDDPNIKRAQITNFPLSNFTAENFVSKLVSKYYSDISLVGKFNDLDGYITIINRSDPSNFFRLNTRIQNLFHANKTIQGRVQLKNLSGDYLFNLSPERMTGKFEFPEGITGNILFDVARGKKLDGTIDLNDLNVMQIFSDSLISDDFRLMGALNGRIRIGGDIANPNLAADIRGDKFVFNDIGYYQTSFKLRADTSRLVVDSLLVSLNNLPFVKGNLQVDLKDQKTSGQFTGQGIDVEQILTTILPEHVIMSGTADYELDITGQLNHPRLQSSIHIYDGVLDRLLFDELHFALSDHVNEDGRVYDFSDHHPVLENIFMKKEGDYTFKGVGNFPLNPADEIDMELKFTGDALGFLPLWFNFFPDATSNTEIALALAGRRDQIRIRSGYCQIERGELWMKQVVPHIENINGLIELKEGTNQVNFIDFKGSVGDQTLTINTVRDIVTSERGRLDPWYFRGIDLDFGILKLETSEDGIELNIPGLMTAQDVVHLSLSAKTEADKAFYFAGPIRHPLAYGLATLYDSRVTFPFLPTGPAHKKTPLVLEFLMNINWDVLVRSGEDVVYFREIPAYIDNVNTEVFIDESSPGLQFTGIINNGTFRPLGKITSSRGRLEYLDQNFKVDWFSLELNEWDEFPVISGRAWTTIRDSIGAVPKTIYLQLYAIDEETGAEKQQGRWEEFKFKLVSADPQIGESQEQVLSYLGFSVGNIRQKATSVGGAVTEKYLIRPLLRPLERAMERRLGIDLVRINSNIAKNLFYTGLGFGGPLDRDGTPLVNPFTTDTPYLFLMQSSELTIGKYISQNLFLSYTGQLVSLYDQSNSTSFDFNHSFGIEYRFLRNVLLEFEYDRELMGYYKVANQKQYLEDFKIRLRHSFSF